MESDEKKLTINPEECNRDIRTYGDVIRHMTNQELALFLINGHFNLEMGLMAIIRAKTYMHRMGGDPMVETKPWESMHRFMEHRIDDEEVNWADIWGVENWQDMCQWESKHMKNFGMDVVY